jgi:hypothetical protein
VFRHLGIIEGRPMSAAELPSELSEHLTVADLRRRLHLGPYAARTLAKRCGGIRVGKLLLVRRDRLEEVLRQGAPSSSGRTP